MAVKRAGKLNAGRQDLSPKSGIIKQMAARWMSRKKSRLDGTAESGKADYSASFNEQPDALLLIKQGGLGVWANARARELFHLKDGESPNLERISRRLYPGEDFLRLTASGGHARFTLANLSLEASAYSVPFQGETYRVVVLRPANLGAELGGEDVAIPAPALLAVAQLLQGMSASLDLERTLQAIQANIQRLIPADLNQIILWDAKASEWTPYRLKFGPAAQAVIEQSTAAPGFGYDFPLRLLHERTPLLIRDVSLQPAVITGEESQQVQIQSYLGVPLLLDNELIGALELGSFELEGFQPGDARLLTLISTRAASSIRNALLFSEEKRRAAELNGLAQLTQALSSIRDPHGLYEHLVNSIAPLLRADLLGFLIYNETTRMLEGQAPFTGMPSQFMELYRVPIPTGSALEKAYLSQEVIASEQAAQDPRWVELGLTPVAAAASLRETVLIPLVSGGRMLGYLQASNHSGGSQAFSQDELHLLTIIASQVAPIIENASLLQQLRIRAQRSEALRRISSLCSSAATPEEILQFSLQELASLLQADYALLFTMNKERTALQLHRPSCHGDVSEISILKAGLSADDPQFPFTASGSLHNIHTNHGLPIKPLVPFYQEVLAALECESLAAAPLVQANVGIGEIWMCSCKSDFFEPGDLQVIAAASGSLAGVVERLVDDPVGELRREQHRLETLLKVTTELSASLDIQQVLVRSLAVVNEAVGAEESLILVSQGIHPYRAGVRLADLREDGSLDDNSVVAQIHQAVMRSRHYELVVSLAEDSRWTRLPEWPVKASSLVAVPLILGEEVMGSLLLLHNQPAFFHSSQIDLLQAVARQVASTLKNAELFNLIRDQSENLGGMLRDQQIETSRSLAILEAVADGVVVTDAARRITFLNASAGQILEVSTEELTGQPLERLGSLVGKAGSEWVDTIRGWLPEDVKEVDGQTYLGQLTLDNGRVIAIHLAPVIWRSTYLGTVSIFRDITHQVQVDRLKSEFITNVSHELRTPLTSIKGYADLMLMGASGDMSEQQKHFVGVIRENALRLQGLVDDLLDVSRIQAGRIVLDFQPVDLAGVVEDVAAEMRHLANQEKKSVTFTLEYPPNLPSAHGDRARIYQVLRSLALNGYKYTPENGAVSIAIKTAHPSELQVDVRDTGIGIPAEDQPRIFDRFFRGEHPLVMATPGTGLGLALAKILVEMMDGRIWFQSSGEAGKGSVFSVTLPVHAGEGKS